MNHAWMCPVPLEKSVARDPALSGMFVAGGDSMLMVDKRGKRVANEKLQYNELAQAFFSWDAVTAEYSHLVLIAVWDERSAQHSSGSEFGNLIPPPGADASHVVIASTLEELADGVRARLARHRDVTGNLDLDPSFSANLAQSISRFNAFAEAGVDEDFARGSTPVQLMFNGPVADSPRGPNATMFP
jgi:hypothetical protein